MEQTGGNTDIESLDIIEATMEQTGGNNMLPTDIESLDIIEKQRYLTDKQRYLTDATMEETGESNIGQHTDIKDFFEVIPRLDVDVDTLIVFPRLHSDVDTLIQLKMQLKMQLAMRKRMLFSEERFTRPYILPYIWLFDRLYKKPDGTSVDEPPNRKRKINRNGMYTQEYAEGPNQSQESGLWGRFVGTTRDLANMCKSVPKDITSKLAEKCGESMDTVISMFMNIMREGGKIPEKFAEIMKSAENASLSDKLLGRFAGLIGNGWELLGFELGLSSVDIDHVRADRRESTMMAIQGMLRKWMTSKQEEAKASDLLLAMWKCKKVNVNWSGLATIFL